jgi:putative endonuclease
MEKIPDPCIPSAQALIDEPPSIDTPITMTVNWSVYIIRCSDGSLYTGITTDIDRRFHQHENGTGAKYFRSRKPERIVLVERGYDRSSATKRERNIKSLNRGDKMLLIAQTTESCNVFSRTSTAMKNLDNKGRSVTTTTTIRAVSASR